MLPLTYIPALLEQVKAFVVKKYGEALRKDPFAPLDDFTEFAQICHLVEENDRAERKGASPAAPSSGRKSPTPEANQSGDQKRGKKKAMRDWGDIVNKETLESLDLSSDKGSSSVAGTTTTSDGKLNLMSSEEFSTLKDLEYELEDLSTSAPSKKGIWNYFETLTGQKELGHADLVDSIGKMREHLIHKNVAAEVADVICQSVTESLLGKKTGTFTSTASMVNAATETAVSRVLMPKGSIDLLGDIQKVRSISARPYVMTFVGVNGVGKSTNLSKVCFWLMQNKLKVLLVAGDTFRSGAVEQLQTHVKNLSTGRLGSVELFERGYGKDAAAVAKEAISYARNQKCDVVMIDTAGRMQDNSPLMAALAKLVAVNKPDKLVFVGEALVGNEAVDQLKKFNGALRDYSGGGSSADAKLIDGILLTKFDTIDDKVGAALSMTFIANAPILFVGVGQTYMDLRKLNVKAVVNSLLK